MRSFLLTALALALSSGCAANASLDDDGWSGGGSSGTGGTSSNSGPTSLDFVAGGDVLDARAQVEVVAQALPAGVYRVRFSLPSDVASPRDAALSAAEVETDASGRAQVILTAPSSAGKLSVRATIGELTATKSFSVAGPETATLRVQPVRQGHRQATTWVATVHQRKTCADVPGVPPEDGELSTRAAATDAPEIEGVETGVPLAVTLRSGHFMGGCQTVDMLPPEASSTPRIVQVTVLDRPLQLGSSSLDLSLGLTETAGSWDAVLTSANAAVLAALHGSASVSDVDALLDTMQAALPGAAQQAFLNARFTENWDTVTLNHWGSATKLTDLVSAWLGVGKARLTPGEATFVGWLEATSEKKANYRLKAVAGMAASQAGFSQDAQVTWSAGPDDTVLLSTFLYFSSSRLLTSLAEPPILEAQNSAPNVGAVLADRLDCAGLGSALAAAGSDGDIGYAGCDATCLANSCGAALASIWQRGRDAAGPMQLGVAATGKAWVGEEAELSGMTGSWVGKLVATEGELPTGGALTGAQPPLNAE